MDLKGLAINKWEGQIQIINSRNEIIIEGSLLPDKLYQLHCIIAPALSSKSTIALTSKIESTNNLELWHHRFGHLNYKYLHQLDKNNMVSDLNLLGNLSEAPSCEGYALGKHPRAIFKAWNEINTRYPIERLHGDLQGPFKTLKYGYKYVLAIVDDYLQKG